MDIFVFPHSILVIKRLSGDIIVFLFFKNTIERFNYPKIKIYKTDEKGHNCIFFI